MIKNVVMVTALVLAISSKGSASTWEETIDITENRFEKTYCFKELKRQFFHWDLATEIDKTRSYLRGLSQPVDPVKARSALIQFFETARDIHVAGMFDTGSPYAKSKLPLAIRSVDSKNYSVISIDREKLPKEQYPFEVGDTLVSLGGKPIQHWINLYLPKKFAKRSTQQALAERYALSHFDLLGKAIPSGRVYFEVKSALTGVTSRYETEWITQNKASLAAPNIRKGFTSEGIIESSGQIISDGKFIGNYGVMNAKKPFFPEIGKVIWQAEESSPFFAYISELSNGKKAGFVRIPTYFPDKITTVQLPAFYSLIDRFVEEKISVLTLDQTNNFGGSVLYAYDLFSALIDRPIESPINVEWIVGEVHHEMDVKWTALKEFAQQSLTDPEARGRFQTDIFPDKVIDDAFLNAFIPHAEKMIRLSEDASAPRLSPKLPLDGARWILPRKGRRYLGPIVMLVNELSISAADVTPALFQDTKRALLFGSPTSGAGAYQSSFDAPKDNPFGLLRTTVSFGKITRKFGVPIENLGVKPDVSYEVKERDLREGMSGYAEALEKTLERITRD